ncbi:unnamed protein product [Absidia cylindrospora]
MLACTHDLFFNNSEYSPAASYASRLPSNKDKDEQVWPPDVESAFIQALETIPKLGRRKILVNGKPCGRNELISDFIYRQTAKLRTRKQVSSHIQVLKNTRKNDPHFMRLLTDASQENDMLMDPLLDNNGLMYYHSTVPPPLSSAAPFHHRPSASTPPGLGHPSTTPSSSSATLSSASSSDWMMYYDSSMLPINNNTPSCFSTSQSFMTQPAFSSYYYNDQSGKSSMTNTSWPSSIYFSVWPSFTSLYLESPLDNTSTTTNKRHMLAQGHDQDPNNLRVQDASRLSLKCPWQDLQHLLTRLPASCPFMYSQVWLDIQLDAIVDSTQFHNTSLYQSRDGRTLECITSVYSFGTRVLETKETQMATPSSSASANDITPGTTNGSNASGSVYAFTFINPFLEAFLKGLRSLSSWEEINVAIDNLCVIQRFEDVHTKEPLLAILFDFKQTQHSGTGAIQLMLLGSPPNIPSNDHSPSS